MTMGNKITLGALLNKDSRKAPKFHITNTIQYDDKKITYNFSETICDCSKLYAPDLLTLACFHFRWRVGGDGGWLTPVSSLEVIIGYDFSFSFIIASSSLR